MSTKFIEPGFYGKVHTHGDFVNGGLPKSFIDPWDTWLQEAISTSRQQLGDTWLNYYLTSPLYRFVLSPGICGKQGWQGVLMPSVDKIGRYYPMTISLMDNKNINPFIALQIRNKWFVSIEKLVLSCLEDNFNLENFNYRLSHLRYETESSTAETEQSLMPIPEKIFHHAWQQPLKSIESIPNLLPYILDNSLKEHCFAYSLWWTQGSELVSPSLLICEGLPHFEGMAALFDGNWQKWGWEGQRYPIPPFENYNCNHDDA
jgi:type VI secretion system protein ImpM